MGVYVNFDEIEAAIKQNRCLNLGVFEIETDKDEVLEFFRNSTLLGKAELPDEVDNLLFTENRSRFFNVGINSYLLCIGTDFIFQTDRSVESVAILVSLPLKVASYACFLV